MTLSNYAPYEIGGISHARLVPSVIRAKWDCSAVIGVQNSGNAVGISGVEAQSSNVELDGLDAGDRRLHARCSRLRCSGKKLRRRGRRCPKLRFRASTMMKISSSLEREYSGAAALNRSDAALSNDGDVVSMYIPRARFTFHKVNLTLQRLPAFPQWRT